VTSNIEDNREEKKLMIKLKVNGVARQFDGDPEMPLPWFLRDELNLKGAKFGCGRGEVF
jgi:isoquinoline 1-oxidoreductase alpha subunit